MKTINILFGALFAAAILLVCEVGYTAEKTEKEQKIQTECPVMGGAVNKSLYYDYKGKRIYVCCAGCINMVKQDPEKYIRKIEAKGEALEKVPAAKDNEKKAKGAKGCCK